MTKIERGAFHNTAIKEITIPAGVTTIPASMFESCTSLEKVTFLGNIQELTGSDIFYNCNSLKEIHINAENPPTVTDNLAFNYFTKSSCTLYVPTDDSVTAYGNDDNWKDFIIKKEGSE